MAPAILCAKPGSAIRLVACSRLPLCLIPKLGIRATIFAKFLIEAIAAAGLQFTRPLAMAFPRND